MFVCATLTKRFQQGIRGRKTVKVNSDNHGTNATNSKCASHQDAP